MSPSQSSSAASQEAHDLARRLFDAGDIAAAGRAYGEILASTPDDRNARIALRECALNNTIGDRDRYISQVIGTIYRGSRFINDAMPGWLYSQLIEGQFVDADLKQINSKSEPQTDSTPSITQSNTAQGLLNDLQKIEGTTDLYLEMQRIRCLHIDAVLGDTLVSCPSETTVNALGEAFTQDTINILIIGGGCVGLTLANSLRSALGTRINIAVLENRVYEDHVKKPYSRSWLTFIPLKLLDGVIDPGVVQLLSRVGDRGFMGVPIDVYETLLLLSCKAIGVQFLFRRQADLSIIRNLPIDMLFDATGGRLQSDNPDETDGRPGPVYTGCNLSHYSDGFARFGIPRRVPVDLHDVSTCQVGRTMLPLYQGGWTRIANIKVTGIRADLYQPLLELISGDNRDGRFYVWPGVLKHEINQVLILICLRRHEYEALTECIQTAVPLAILMSSQNVRKQLDSRILRVLEFLATGDQHETVRVERPFIFEPRLRLPPSEPDSFHGKPLLPVGDSIFNGNPRVGNGLGRHIHHVRRVHDCFLLAATEY